MNHADLTAHYTVRRDLMQRIEIATDAGLSKFR